jgi:hypothetical protein
MVGQFGNDPAVIRTTFSCSLFYWSRTIAVDRANAAETWVINLQKLR